MNKKLFFAAATLALVTSCMEDNLATENGSKTNPDGRISFTQKVGNMTRASHQAQEAGHYEFGVFAITGTEAEMATDESNVAMNDYLVAYTDGTETGINKWYKTLKDKATTWGSNPSGDMTDAENAVSSWFYEGLGTDNGTHADYTVPHYTQVLKYWDDSKDQYNFYAFMPYSKKDDVANNNADKIAYSNSSELTFTKLSSFYTAPQAQVTTAAAKTDGSTPKAYTDENEILNDNEALYAYKNVPKGDYNKDVQLDFKHINAKVRIKFYEVVSGYDVEIIDLRPANTVTKYADTDKALYEGIAFSPATAVQAATPSSNVQPTDLPEYVDYADVTVKTLSTTPAISYSAENKVKDNLRFKKPTTNIGTTAANATESPTIYYPLKKVAAASSGKDCGYTLHVSYKLTPTVPDGSAPLYVYDARVHVAEEYTLWEEGKAYTYIFKITDQSNGTTDPNKVDPATGSGIQEPWVDPEDPRVPDDPALKPIVFDGVMVTDYDDVTTGKTDATDEWVITDPSSWVKKTVSSTDYRISPSVLSAAQLTEALGTAWQVATPSIITSVEYAAGKFSVKNASDVLATWPATVTEQVGAAGVALKFNGSDIADAERPTEVPSASIYVWEATAGKATKYSVKASEISYGEKTVVTEYKHATLADKYVKTEVTVAGSATTTTWTKNGVATTPTSAEITALASAPWSSTSKITYTEGTVSSWGAVATTATQPANKAYSIVTKK